MKLRTQCSYQPEPPRPACNRAGVWRVAMGADLDAVACHDHLPDLESSFGEDAVVAMGTPAGHLYSNDRRAGRTKPGLIEVIDREDPRSLSNPPRRTVPNRSDWRAEGYHSGPTVLQLPGGKTRTIPAMRRVKHRLRVPLHPLSMVANQQRRQAVA